MQHDIQLSDQAANQLITKLAELLEQANGVLADSNRARRAERPEQPPPEPQQHQPQRDEPQQHQPPQDGPTAQHQNWRWWTETQQEYHRSYADAAQPAQRQPWRDNAQPAEQPESWREWTDLEDTGELF